jgi:hypothetical protein
MRVLEMRLRKLEVGLLPHGQAGQTEASLRYYDVVLTIARNRARMRGEPLPDTVACNPQTVACNPAPGMHCKRWF